MKTLPRIVAIAALAATIVPAVLFAFKLMSEEMMKGLMLAGTVAWFAAAPFWLKGGES